MEKPFKKCRLCLKIGDFCSIFEIDDSIRLCDMVMSIARIDIHEDDGLPNKICPTCVESLSSAYLFKLQCERNNNLLKKTVDSTQSAPKFNTLLEQEFHLHSEFVSREQDNLQQQASDGPRMGWADLDNPQQASDGPRMGWTSDTDSDAESVKCVYCNECYKSGAHSCRVPCDVERALSSSTETLVAADRTPPFITPDTSLAPAAVACVLCDDKHTDYAAYERHFNECTANVKLRHYVCPVCHEIFTLNHQYLQHLKINHFRQPEGEDTVDAVPLEKVRRPKAVRRQIGWSIEDIYQEIEYRKVEESGEYHTPTSSPLKSFFNKLGNESFSRQSTPKRVSFRKLIEDGKTKTSNYFHIGKYIQSYKQKKKEFSPIKGKMQVSSKVRTSLAEVASDSDCTSPSGTSEESWKLKQNLICACDKKVFMISEFIQDRDRVAAMLTSLGGVVAESTRMEMLATHFVAALPRDTHSGMMVCALATGKWLLHVGFVYDSFRAKRFAKESAYEWMRHPKLLELDSTSAEAARAAVHWHLELRACGARLPFEGRQVVLIMRRKYRQYYQMIFKALKAKPIAYDPRTPGSCCNADYCFVDMKVIEKVRLKFFAQHNVPVFPYQYILVYLLRRGRVDDEDQYLLQDWNKSGFVDALDCLNTTY